MRSKTRKLIALLIGAIVVPVIMLAAPTGANAAAFAYDVYPPKKENGQLVADARLSRDCAGTFGCWNYMKLERTRLWGNEFITGKWAPYGGWNKISNYLPAGCHDYRLVVDSYNDMLVSQGVGVQIKVVGVSASGEKIATFKRTWASGYARICR